MACAANTLVSTGIFSISSGSIKDYHVN